MTATIYDVARLAEVGIGTVSRVLNNSPNVRPETRRRVLSVIEELNYRPSSVAQNLSLRRTLTIGVIAPFFTRPSVVERLRGIEAAIAHTPYDLTVHNVETPENRNAHFQDQARGQRVDGLIIISLTPTDADVAHWAALRIPVVLVDTVHPSLSHVATDDVASGRLAAEHLIALGHHLIAFAGDPLTNPFNFTSSQNRLRGYRQALAAHEIPFVPHYHQAREHGREPARHMTRELLQLPDPPTAIMAASDTQALGVIEAARALGADVPEDLSVMGFDDIEVAEFMQLTTVRQALFESGRLGAELLLATIDDLDAPPISEILPVELVVRKTTAPPAQHRDGAGQPS